MRQSYDSFEDACHGLLLTTASIFNESGIPYAVAGGWVPKILGKHPILTHPGTRDVDVLLLDKSADPAPVATMLLDAGFQPSAKHEFQLMRSAEVGGRAFVFNVDLLHPHEARNQPDMFCDVLDLEVPDKLDRRGHRYLKSVAFNNASLISQLALCQLVQLQGKDLDGSNAIVDVSLLTPAAAVLSKCESCAIKKRYRDAFDIYYLLSGEEGQSCAEEILDLADQADGFAQELGFLRSFIDRDAPRFDSNVRRYGQVEESPAHFVKSRLFT
jgi:hypothetical protein